MNIAHVIGQWRIWLCFGSLIVALCLALFLGCSSESSEGTPLSPEQSPLPSNQKAVVQDTDSLGSSSFFGGGRGPDLGPSSLEERILFADVIARVKLKSVVQVVEYIEFTPPFPPDFSGKGYVVALEFTFDVLEYLKGSDGSQVTGVTTDVDVTYETEQEASAKGEDFLTGREQRWDDREAVVFLHKPPWLPSTKQEGRYQLGILRAFGEEEYTIANRYDQPWLPDAAAPEPSEGSGSEAVAMSSGSSGEQSFLLEEPPEDRVVATRGDDSGVGQTATVTLSALKDLISDLQADLDAGDGTADYKVCLLWKYMWERNVEMRISDGADYSPLRRDSSIGSGMPSGSKVTATIWTRLNLDQFGEVDPGGLTHWFAGQDAALFTAKYPATLHTVRPLPSAVYRFHYREMNSIGALCDAYPDEMKMRYEFFVTVTAPDGTLHEALFDPVVLGTAVVADDYRGQLSPATYSVGSSETTLRRIGWDEERAWVEFSSAPSLAGHHVDFIELDGSVGLRLDFDDATAVSTDAGGQALVWGVCGQPWADGDLLMLRISESGDTLTGTTNDATCDGAAVSLSVPLKTASFSPASDAYIKPVLAPSGTASGCGTAGLYACLDEAAPDGDASMVNLFNNSALRVGFSVGSGDASGTLADMRFEVSLRAQSGTVDAGAYGFTVYNGSNAVATVSGQESLGTEWTTLTVSDPSLTSGLSSGLSGVALQVNGPTSGSRLLVTWVRMVVDYKPTGS